MTKALELAKFGRETPPAGVVVGDSDTQTLSAKTFSDMPVFSSGTVDGVAYLNGSKALTTSSNLTFNGSLLTVSDLRDSSLTAGRITYAGTAGNLVDSANLVFTGTGVGVGTDSPSGRLHVSTSGPSVIRNQETSVGVNSVWNASDGSLTFFGNESNHPLAFISNSIEQMRITTTGLGIGTNSPGFKLDVNGDARIGNATAATNRNLFINGVANKAQRIVFQESGVEKWLIGQGAASENGNFEIYSALGNNTVITPAGNLGLGADPQAWGVFFKSIQYGNRGGYVAGSTTSYSGNSHFAVGNNGYFDSVGNWRATVSDGGGAVQYYQVAGTHRWNVATPVTAGGIISFTEMMQLNSAGLNFPTVSSGNGNISYDGSTFTIVSNSSSASMVFSTNSAERMRLTSTGRLGIGTTNPSATLTVAGVLRVEHSGTAAYGIQAVGGAGTANDILLAGQSGYSNGFTVKYNGTNMLYTFQDGNVGVGTTDPQDKLHVAGAIRSNASTTGTLYLGGTSGTSYIAAALVATPSTLYGPVGKLSFQLPTHGVNTDYGLTEQMFIEGTSADSRGAYKLVMLPHGGNVGIGTNNPTVSLEVNGFIKASNLDINQNDRLIFFTKTGTSAPSTSSNYTHFIGRVDSNGFHVTTGAGGFDGIADSFVVGAKGSLILATSTPTSNYSSGRVIINQTGDVGVGTASPQSKLHVVGGVIRAGTVDVGRVHTDIMAMWRTADIQGYTTQASDGGAIGYSWDNGVVRIDNSVGSHNWDIGKIRLTPGTYQLVLVYRPSPTQHEWNVYGTNSNGHAIRLQSDAEYATRQIFISADAYAINKDLGYSITYTSGTYTVSTETTFRIGMSTDPYSGGGYKCFIEAAYLVRLN